MDARMDAAAWSSIAEYVSALGTDGVDGDPDAPGSLTVEQLERLMATPLGHSLAYGLPQDAFAEGWRVRLGDEADATAELDEQLGIQDALVSGVAIARGMRGAWLWPCGPESVDLASPAPSTAQRITAVHVLSSREVTPIRWDSDRASRRWGRPELLQVTPLERGTVGGAIVHASRLVYVPGAPTPDSLDVRPLGYDLAYLDLYHPAIVRIHRALASLGRSLERQGMPAVLLEPPAAAATAADDLKARLVAMFRFMRRFSALPVSSREQVTWSSISLAGAPESIRALWESLASVERRPLTALIGVAPGGLGTDDESGRRAEDAARARCQAAATPVLQALYDLIRGRESGRRIEWAPIGQPSASEAADISLRHAQRDEVLVRIGAITDAEVRERFRGETEDARPVLLEEYDIQPGDDDPVQEVLGAPVQPALAPEG
jgi:hypothetical protein